MTPLFAVVCADGSLCGKAVGAGSQTRPHGPFIDTAWHRAQDAAQRLDAPDDPPDTPLSQRRWGERCKRAPHRVVQYVPGLEPDRTLVALGRSLMAMAKDWGPRTDPARAEWIVRLGAFERALHDAERAVGPAPAPTVEELAVDRFAKIMKLKLAANMHKVGWADMDATWLVSRELEETAELLRLLRQSATSWVEVALEAADVGNFAMMVADNALRDSARSEAASKAAERALDRVFPCAHKAAAQVDVARCVDSELAEHLWCANCRTRARFGQSMEGR